MAICIQNVKVSDMRSIHTTVKTELGVASISDDESTGPV